VALSLLNRDALDAIVVFFFEVDFPLMRSVMTYKMPEC
jgi:hypothetical protein